MLQSAAGPSRATTRLAAAIVVLTVLCAIGLQIIDIPIDALPFQLKNKDFANYWLGGKLGLSGESFILFGDPQLYFERMKAIFGADYPWHNWSYPPHAVLLLLPLGLMSFLPAMALFLGLTLALYILAIGALPARWTPIGVILLVPFLVANLVATQNGFLTGALMVGGLALRDRRPWLAGILFGLLTFKPQLGVLLAVLLLCERQWRVIGAAVLTSALLVLVSIAVFGADSWRDFYLNIVPQQTETMNTLGGAFPHMMTSAFGAARSLGYGAALAMKAHLPFAAMGAVLFGLSLFRLRDASARAFSMLLASFLIVPYSVAYDLGALAAFAALWPLGDRPAPSQPLRILLILVAVLPIAMLPLGQAGLPITPILLLATYILLLQAESVFSSRSVRDDASSPATPSTQPPR